MTQEQYMMDRTKAILVVSFGTTYEETRKKTLDKIEENIRRAYPEWHVYRAWTSGMICKKILERDGLYIPGVKQALSQMLTDGISKLVVLPTHVMCGIENDKMIEDISAFEHQFEKVVISDPLLGHPEDCTEVIQAVTGEYTPGDRDALVFMGHGSDHYANTVYAALDYQFKDMGFFNIHMGTVENYPPFESVLKMVAEQQPEHIFLAPFMMVAGDHAENDLFGEDEDSWKSRFEAAGYEVECVRKGLGEYAGIQQILFRHLQTSVQSVQ